jgi:nucleoside-diphosphate-sugar epimerase
MRLLVLGGTKFLGRHVVEAALEAGHEVTLFNRGITAPDLFPEVELVPGDRDGGLEPLRGRSWEAAIDTSGYVPRVVRASAELLAGAVEHFTYWARRVRLGGRIVAPGPPDRCAQFIDVRDLAAWMLELAQRRESGVFNATSPGVAWGDLLAGADVVWMPDELLQEQGVDEWIELPLWIADSAFAGMHKAAVSRALAAGLRIRPTADTLRGAAEAPLVAGDGLTPEREEELLSGWEARV